MNNKLSIDKGLKLKKLPDEFGEQWPNVDDLLYNLQRIMGHLMGENESIAASTLWWIEQAIKNDDSVEGSINEIARQQAIDAEEERQLNQLRAVAIAKLRQKIIQHMPYPPFRDETLVELDNVLRLFGYYK